MNPPLPSLQDADPLAAGTVKMFTEAGWAQWRFVRREFLAGRHWENGWR
jgi:hypothetical protein